MKRLFYIFMMLLSGAGIVAARKYEVKTGEFTRLNVPDNLEVVYTCDPARSGTATFECPDSLADALLFTNTGNGQLKVQISSDFIGKKVQLPKINVYSEFLTELESSSEKQVTINALPRCPQFKAILFGNGQLLLNDVEARKLVLAMMAGKGVIRAEGNTSDALLKLAGAGKIDAQGLNSDKVTCHVFGGGEIHCKPIKELKLKGLGSTTVYYYGNPEKIKKQGIGKLIKADK